MSHVSFNTLCLIVLCTFLFFLSGCAVREPVPVRYFPPPAPPPPPLIEKIEKNDFSISNKDDVVGRLAVIRLEKGDTLPDIARQFSLGIKEISATNPGVDIWAPEAGGRIMLPLSFILPDIPRNGIVINTAAMRLFHFKGSGTSLAVSTYPVGIGSLERPSPMGKMYVARKMTRPTWYVPASIARDHQKKGSPLPAKVPPGPQNPLGEYALYLSRPSYLIHGTNKPSSIGLRATNGCIRLYPEDIRKLYEDTPVNTPVHIVNQPYLIGWRDGVIYMEVHAPIEELDAGALDGTYAKLRNIEKESARPLDWGKVKKALAEARGIPVPIFERRPGNAKEDEEAAEVKRPDKFYGKPEIPEWKIDAWYIFAASFRDEVDAARIAAIINHQGPQIPARVLAKNDSFNVIAGPFNNLKEARDAAKRLKIDLEIDGILMEPARTR